MHLLARRPPPWLLILADTVVAVLLALAPAASPPELTTSALTVALCWLLAVPVAVRRIWPEPACYGALLLGIAVLSVQANRLLPTAVAALTLYPVAAGLPVRRSAIALVASLLVNGASLLVSMRASPRSAVGWPDPVFILGMSWLVIAASWSLGTAARTRREFAAPAARPGRHAIHGGIT
ncbi:DUF7134 domain-containing protein, partial [Nonomuraea maheshkhaliensis]|uniref:DUF7134 domain-containing protein n=1 Tax=Nonomuraea maheshkhaliensis TaxID=419590 RepID=UPI003D15D4E8